ncbi:hypothetical protein LPTSP2_38100 [Leptospira ellinghausenii]|uniref:Uncharacterized protein n=1 Tax=Leptospira ellinghausenii TaxID=1917822 RepID=A0A2P2DIL1_9LEPT|nr:hypothetical protein [Leptospira ellinghausenii]GBF44507.1 hypothetical protein LPTSP2_38100 [Leptospira ellinghausenii]
MNKFPLIKDFEFKERNTYKMNFESSFLENATITLAAQKSNRLDSITQALVTIVENKITAILPDDLKRGDYEYDLEINRNGIIITEFKGRVSIT